MSAHNDTDLPPLTKYNASIDAHWDSVSSMLHSSQQSMAFALLQREDQLRSALQALAEDQGKLDGAGDVLGRICVLGTLEHGEKPVHDELSKHASVHAIINQIERAEAAEGKLAEVERQRDEEVKSLTSQLKKCIDTKQRSLL